MSVAKPPSDLAKVWDLPKAVCPVGSIGHRWDPYDQHAMYKVLGEARQSEPVFYSPELDYWVVTRYDDVMSILRNPSVFSAANANTPVAPVPQEALSILDEGGYALEGIQVNCDPPRHDRIRTHVSQAMGMKRLMALEPHIVRNVELGIKNLQGKNRVDILKDFIYEFPARVIFSLLDIPERDAAQVKAWAMDRALMSFTHSSKNKQIDGARNLVEFWNYCVKHVQKKMLNPGDDYVSDLLAVRDGDDDKLTLNEINSAAFGLLFAGHETTTNQSTHLLNALLSGDGLWQQLVDEPSLIPSAVEEGLRMYGAVANWRRRAVEDVTIGGMDIPAGSGIVISFAAANRDPEMFEDPDEFRLDRKNVRKHLTFGNGLHFCMGAPLARLEMKLLFQTMTREFPNMKLAADEEIDFVRAFGFRAPKSLWVDLQG